MQVVMMAASILDDHHKQASWTQSLSTQIAALEHQNRQRAAVLAASCAAARVHGSPLRARLSRRAASVSACVAGSSSMPGLQSSVPASPTLMAGVREAGTVLHQATSADVGGHEAAAQQLAADKLKLMNAYRSSRTSSCAGASAIGPARNPLPPGFLSSVAVPPSASMPSAHQPQLAAIGLEICNPPSFNDTAGAPAGGVMWGRSAVLRGASDTPVALPDTDRDSADRLCLDNQRCSRHPIAARQPGLPAPDETRLMGWGRSTLVRGITTIDNRAVRGAGRDHDRGGGKDEGQRHQSGGAG
jgi:hypothetical protein